MLPDRRQALLVLVAGALTPLAFAPFKLFPVAVITVAVLFHAWLNAAGARAARLGFLYGLGLFGVGASWVFVSMHNFGNLNSLLAGFATFLFVGVLASFPALAGLLQARFRRLSTRTRLLLVMPFLWSALEWLRGWLFTGFPWLNLGYSQVSTPLNGFAPWLGVYAMSLLVTLAAGLLVLWYRQGVRRGWKPGVALVSLWLLGLVAGSFQWVKPFGDPVRVALIQANVPIVVKWDPYYRNTILDLYLQLSREHRDADLVVWPEGALPMYLDQLEGRFLRTLEQEAQTYHTDFLFGVVEREHGDEGRRYYNAVASIGSTHEVYRKRHLVPFGEYPPLRPVFSWLINALRIPMSDFSSEDRTQAPMALAGQRIGLSICYESAYGEEVIRALPTATLLVNVSENAWFGESLGPHQLLQMTRLRAIETGRPILRADNAGLSAVIDHRGRVLALSPRFRQSVVEAGVQPMQGATPYTLFGNWPVVWLLFTGLAGAEWLRRRAAIDPSGKTP